VMSCHVEVFIIIFRAQLEVEFHRQPQCNAILRSAKLDTDHPCEQDVSGLSKELLYIKALCAPVAQAMLSEVVR
jgi:hypothetical protein